MKEKLCKKCAHSKVLPSRSWGTSNSYRVCAYLTPENKQTHRVPDWVICFNAREETGDCGPEGKFWQT